MGTQTDSSRLVEDSSLAQLDKLLEVPAQHRDGRSISIAFTVSLLVPPGQTKPVGIAAVIRDDTVRWQERRALNTRVRALAAAGGEA